MLCDDGRGTSHLTVSTLDLSIPCFRIVGYGHGRGQVPHSPCPIPVASGSASTERIRTSPKNATTPRQRGIGSEARMDTSEWGAVPPPPTRCSLLGLAACGESPLQLAAQGRISVFTARLPDAIERKSSGNSSSAACPSTKSADRMTPDSISSNARRMVLGVWWNEASRVRLE
jgi:hypothetical protein